MFGKEQTQVIGLIDRPLLLTSLVLIATSFLVFVFTYMTSLSDLAYITILISSTMLGLYLLLTACLKLCGSSVFECLCYALLAGFVTYLGSAIKTYTPLIFTNIESTAELSSVSFSVDNALFGPSYYMHAPTIIQVTKQAASFANPVLINKESDLGWFSIVYVCGEKTKDMNECGLVVDGTSFNEINRATKE